MELKKFWEMIREADLESIPDPKEWSNQLTKTLSTQVAEEIVAWDQLFGQLAVAAYSLDLWGAAYVINGGASDDGFYYFRCWLIGKGQRVYEAALSNPDSLAEEIEPGVDCEAELHAAAHHAWLSVTGKSYDDPYPARYEAGELNGKEWDFDDPVEVRKRLPRLAKLLGY